MNSLSPVSLRQLHTTLFQLIETDRFPPDVCVAETPESPGFRLFYRETELQSFDICPGIAQVRRALRAYFRECLSAYLASFGTALSERFNRHQDIEVVYSIEHELAFFDEDDSSTHIFLVKGDLPFPFNGEIRLHSHLAKASLSLAAGEGLPETSADQLLSGFDRFVFADTLDDMIAGVADQILGSLQAVPVAA